MSRTPETLRASRHFAFRGLLKGYGDNMKEVWKDIAGYEGLYQVSNHGRVKSLERTVRKKSRWGGTCEQTYPEKLKTLVKHNAGYVCVELHKNNKTRMELVHRLVAEAFIPNPEGKNTVNHIDGDKQNNRVENLEWATYTENNKHARNVGLNKPENIAKGMANPCFMNKNNSSGRKGVYFDKRTGKWMAYITIKGKMNYLGRYKNIDDAIKAREEKEKELF